ncbi:MAG: PAS domain S-box protein [Deltaproteobacteria bacterium]|nr:PAS domain S-box protein [Deltaproteobacteria bacterium]
MDEKRKDTDRYRKTDAVRPSRSPIGILAIMAGAIFVAEALVMVLFYAISPPEWVKPVLDPALLVLLLSPILYFFLFRPLEALVKEGGKPHGFAALVLAGTAVSIFVAESIVMVILSLLSLPGWLAVLLDPALLLIMLLPVLYYVLFRPAARFVEERGAEYEYGSPVRILIITALSIFVAEAAVMVAFIYLPIAAEEPLVHALLDSTLLIIILSPVLYFVLFRPLIALVREKTGAETALLREKETLRKYLDITSVIVLALDSGGKVALVNKRGSEILGYDERDILGRDWFDSFVPERMRDEARTVFDRLIAGEEEALGFFENPVLTRHGERMILWHNSMLREDDRITGVLSSGEDITERKNAERALRESERRYHQIHNTAFDAIIVADADDRVIDCNPSAEKVFGYKRSELIGLRIVNLMPERYRERHSIGLKSFLETGISAIQGKVAEFDGLRKDGEEFAMELVVNSFTVGGVINFTGMMRDITERKEAERERELIQAQLNQSQKMEAIGKFAGGIAHDFNNILTAIRGNAELAMEGIDKSDPLYGKLNGIILSVMLASKLTRQLLLFSKGQPFELIPLNINTVIEELLVMVTRLIGEEITVSTELAPELWNVSADIGNIEQVIMNLAVNAKDAMPKGGQLTIRTGNAVLSEEDAKKIPDARPGEAVKLTVSDTGTGIRKDLVPRIFEPFFTTKEPGKGTGFGLSVVYGIVRQHGGWITVESEPGQGTTFNIYLPALLAPREPAPEGERAALKRYDGAGEKVLVVESDPKVREFTVTALREHGYEVAQARDAGEAFEVFGNGRGGFHLILCDALLPDKSGFELVDMLISTRPGPGVLMTSGFLNKDQWAAISEKGFSYIQKPFSLAGLLKAVKEGVEHGNIKSS